MFNSEYITISAFDDHKQDNDIISIFYNGEEIVRKKKIKNKKNGQIIRVLKLKKGENNGFAIKAWNMGSVGKNTVKVNFYNGDVLSKGLDIDNLSPIYSITLDSEPGLSPILYLKTK